MKINRIIIAIAAASMVVACVNTDPQIDFAVDTDNINIGPAGGIRKINVSSSVMAETKVGAIHILGFFTIFPI